MYFGESKNFEFVCNQLKVIIQSQCDELLEKYKRRYEEASSHAEQRIRQMTDLTERLDKAQPSELQ